MSKTDKHRVKMNKIKARLAGDIEKRGIDDPTSRRRMAKCLIGNLYYEEFAYLAAYAQSDIAFLLREIEKYKEERKWES